MRYYYGVQKDGYTPEVQLLSQQPIRANARLHFDLKRAVATTISLRITSDPPGARIYMHESSDGQGVYTGFTTPHTFQGALVNPYWKSGFFSVSLDGYAGQTHYFAGTAINESGSIHFQLEPVSESSAAEAASAGDTSTRHKDQGASATGFFVNSDGYILTNQHVIAGAQTIDVRRSDGSSARAVVVAQDRANDLAVLKVDGPSPHVTFSTRSHLVPGQQIVVLGYPLSGILSSEGVLAVGTVSAVSGLGDDVSHVQIAAPIQPGNSGGPLLDDHGLVVGVVRSTINSILMAGLTGDLPQNVNFAIKHQIATMFLDSHRIRYETSASTEKKEPTAVWTDVHSSVVRVEVVLTDP
ncbi:MAG: trypsin-like peptidase domain-containing protein [Planctomycetes bacterium]|nr:trypsin-like peptidase domain-containing protein [Planctomycetota bacterium]